MTLKAFKIINFKPRILKLWKRVFLMVNSETKQKQFSVHRHFKYTTKERYITVRIPPTE